MAFVIRFRLNLLQSGIRLMSQVFSPTEVHASRLVCFLKDLTASDAKVSHEHFTDYLSQLIDFSGSLALSSALDNLSRTEFEPTRRPTIPIKNDFLRRRSAIIKYVFKGFELQTGSSRMRLPNPADGAPLSVVMDFETYNRFYLPYQKEIGNKTQSLRTQVRKNVSEVSAKLAQLADLDAALDSIYSAQTQKSFSVVPRLLEKRFDQLRLENEQELAAQGVNDDLKRWLQPDRWLGKFYNEMRGLLLAELDARLQPVLGLIEALNIEETNP